MKEDSQPIAKEKRSNSTSQPPTPDAEGKAPELSDAFANMNPRWKNWWIRTVFTLAMIFGFLYVIYLGPLAVTLLIFCIQVKCYHEVISVGHIQYRKYNLPWFRTLSWYFLGCSNFFFYGEFAADFFQAYYNSNEIANTIYQYRRFIAFSLYTIGIMLFVLSLKKNYYKVQFALFGWYQITLLIILTPSHTYMQNLLSGLMWFLLPTGMVICNDIWAYICGFFFGRTRLIKLSPKKTWEGFIGAYCATVFFGTLACEMMSRFAYFYCPIQASNITGGFPQQCETPAAFIKVPYYSIPSVVLQFLSVLPEGVQTMLITLVSYVGVHLIEGKVWMYPMMIHTLVLASFASLIAPFGGFFASGFKRAFKIKDFGDTIPGHGGIMDRFDCHLLISIFTNVYIASFIRASNPERILQHIFSMKTEDQVLIFRDLQKALSIKGLL